MSNIVRKIKKEILLDCKSNVIDSMTKVSDKLIDTLPISEEYYELCELYISLHNNLQNLDKELNTITGCERNNNEEEV